VPSLWKRKNSPYWTCCFTAKDGRQLKKSTKKRNRTEALTVCLAFQRAEKEGIEGRLTEVQARKVVAEIVERTTGVTVAFFTVRDWFKTWIEGKAQSKSESTATRYSQIIEDFLAHLDKRAELGLAHITVADIQSFRSAERKKGKSPQTCNQSVKIVGTAFNAARKQGYISSNPVEAVEPLPEDPAEKKPFTVEQVQSLLRVAPDDWKGVIMLGYYTGARLQDITQMKWSAIDLHDGVLRFVPRKTIRTKKGGDAKVTVPMHPQLAAYIQTTWKQRPKDGFIFPKLASQKPSGKSGLSMAFGRIMTKAGIDAGRVERKQGMRTASALSFHSLRHTFTSGLANSGVTSEIRQKLTGHASPEMNARYTHHEVEPLRKAVEMLPAVIFDTAEN
jgi:integrase